MTLVELARAHDPAVLALVGDLTDTAVRLASEPRAEAVCQLVAAADGRVRLEALRDIYVDRLHQCSWDFDATRGLVLTIAALQCLDDLALREPARSA